MNERRLRHSPLACVCAALLTACASERRHDAQPARGGAPAIRQFGAMRPVMREGATEPRVRIAECVAEPHAYGVGALAGLEGEITIIDGEVWISRVDGADIRSTGPETHQDDAATLLTLATVTDWVSVDLARSAADIADLQSAVETAATRLGIDTTRPFPFVVEGESSSLDLHVIRGHCPSAGTIDSASGAWRLSLREPARTMLVGFFARDSEGVLTHHGTGVHVHSVLDRAGRTMTGHVDGVSLAPGAVLRLPRP